MKSPSDPQVAMLARVGAENIDLLLKHAGRNALYANLAVQIIQGGELAPTPITLRGDDATLEGMLKLQKFGRISGWSQKEDRVRFSLSELLPGHYKLIVTYAAPNHNGGEVLIALNDAEWSHSFKGVSEWGTWTQDEIGDFNHAGGALDITFSVIEQYNEGVPMMAIDSVRLEPVNPPPVSSAYFLSASEAQFTGPSVGYSAKINRLVQWGTPEATVHFGLPSLENGSYVISAVYSAGHDHGGKIGIDVNTAHFERTFSPTGSWRKRIEKKIGQFEHEGGEVNIKMSILEKNGERGSVFDLYGLVVTRVDSSIPEN